jgi:hypothetical protein
MGVMIRAMPKVVTARSASATDEGARTLFEVMMGMLAERWDGDDSEAEREEHALSPLHRK